MAALNLPDRPRRLRANPVVRRMVAETTVQPRQLILPAFVAEGITEPRPITTMPGIDQHSIESIKKLAHAAAEAGLAGIMLFGVPLPDKKDAAGSQALADDGILNLAIEAVRAEVGDDLLVMSDVCLDEFTDHGHCGVLTADGVVDNDATVGLYAQMAVKHAEAGAHMVGPSGMMDGQIGAIREALDQAGHIDTSILSYAAKYSSTYYGPFREAVGSSLRGDRKTYQQDLSNVREALHEVRLDLDQGADVVMIKPALSYLDVIARVADEVDVPVAAYNISGEYSMIEAAAERGWLDRDAAITETLTSIRRAGADIILTYWAIEYATRPELQR